jgi:hypothetical protein
VSAGLKTLSLILDGFGKGMSARASGLRTGMITAFNVLLNEIRKGRSHHEG